MHVCATLANVNKGLRATNGVVTRPPPAALRCGGDVAQGLLVRFLKILLDFAGYADPARDTIVRWVGVMSWRVVVLRFAVPADLCGLDIS